MSQLIQRIIIYFSPYSCRAFSYIHQLFLSCLLLHTLFHKEVRAERGGGEIIVSCYATSLCMQFSPLPCMNVAAVCNV